MLVVSVAAPFDRRGEGPPPDLSHGRVLQKAKNYDLLDSVPILRLVSALARFLSVVLSVLFSRSFYSHFLNEMSRYHIEGLIQLKYSRRCHATTPSTTRTHDHTLVRPHFNRPSSAAATVQLVIWYKHVLERLRKKKQPKR